MTDGTYRQELSAWGRAVSLNPDGSKIDGGGSRVVAGPGEATDEDSGGLHPVFEPDGRAAPVTFDGGGRATGRTDAVSEGVGAPDDLTGAPPTVAPRKEGER